jgi:hypothetical protein
VGVAARAPLGVRGYISSVSCCSRSDRRSARPAGPPLGQSAEHEARGALAEPAPQRSTPATARSDDLLERMTPGLFWTDSD